MLGLPGAQESCMKKNDYAIVLTSVESEERAERLANRIVEEKLAACVQIQRVNSFFRWKNSMQKADEFLLMAKTRASLFEKLSSLIRTEHGYDIPEILRISIGGGSREYLNWITAETELGK
jgi:periplasmic divalent cation tolerance protein